MSYAGVGWFHTMVLRSGRYLIKSLKTLNICNWIQYAQSTLSTEVAGKGKVIVLFNYLISHEDVWERGGI
jgi:hypothetical protein